MWFPMSVMLSYPLHSRALKRRGFTLTEVSIVLGIFGLILGAIWTAAARVEANQRVARAVADTLTIVTGVRNIYGKQPFTVAADITQSMVDMGVYPPNMLQPVCPAGTYYTAAHAAAVPCPIDAWGTGAVQVGALAGWFGAPPGAPMYFDVTFFDPAMTDCPAFMAQMIKTASNTGLIWVSADGVNQFTGVNPANLTPTDVANCTGHVSLAFSL